MRLNGANWPQSSTRRRTMSEWPPASSAADAPLPVAAPIQRHGLQHPLEWARYVFRR